MENQTTCHLGPQTSCWTVQNRPIGFSPPKVTKNATPAAPSASPQSRIVAIPPEAPLECHTYIEITEDDPTENRVALHDYGAPF